jgi:hypothetical protein
VDGSAEKVKKKYTTTVHANATEHELYSTWLGIRQRCFNSTVKNYKRYGGRGITMCERWMNDFWAFVADVGPRPSGLTLDRIDNNGHYEPGNVRWATCEEQIDNRDAPGLRLITFRGQTMPMHQWEKSLGFGKNSLAMRLKHGWTLDEAMTTPPRRITRKNLHAYGSRKEQSA